MEIRRTGMRLEGVLFPTPYWKNAGYVLRPSNGLNVIYGKNGVGKTTTISGLKAFIGGNKEPRDRRIARERDGIKVRSTAERGELELYFSFSEMPLTTLAVEWAEGVRKNLRVGAEQTWRYRSGYLALSETTRNYLSLIDDKDGEWTPDSVFKAMATYFGHENVDKVRELVTSPPIEPKGSSEAEMDDEHKATLFAHLLFGLTYDIVQGDLETGYLSGLDEAIGKELKAHYREWNSEPQSADTVNERFSKYDIDLVFDDDDGDLADGNFADLSLHQKIVLCVDMAIQYLEWEFFERPVDYEWLESMFGSPYGDTDVHEEFTLASLGIDYERVIAVIGRALASQVKNPLFRLVKNRNAATGWDVTLAVRDLETHPESSSALRDLRTLIGDLTSEWNGIDIDERVLVKDSMNWWLSTSWFFCWNFSDNVLELPNHFSFIPIQMTIGEMELSPLKIVDLDEPVDVSLFAREVLSYFSQNSDYEGVVLDSDYRSEGESLAELPFSQDVLNAFAPLSALVKDLGIGLRGCKAILSGQVSDWATGDAIHLVFETETRECVFENLSQAQQYWVQAGIRLLAAQGSPAQKLIVADEPDRGLHERAANSVLRKIASMDFDMVISSHSVAALRTRHVALHHLERDADGTTRLGDVRMGDDVIALSERLGTTPYDLLSLKRLMVLVEGSHDVAVTERLLTLSQDPRLNDSVLVVPMRGVKNATSVADSVLVTEFSDLNILVVVDNGKSGELEDLLVRLREAYSTGATSSVLQRMLQESRGTTEFSFEERVLFDLLERTVTRGLLGRIDVHTLPTPDIVDLLPASGFGLTESWEEMRERYTRSGTRENFKTWLHESLGVRISTRTILKALDQMDSVPGPLVRLVQQIELHCTT